MQVTTPSLTDVFTALRAMIIDIVPAGTSVVRGQQNRVPMPPSPCVIMTDLYQVRLATNQTSYEDPELPAPGTKTLQQNTRLDIQLDFYGVDAGQWANAFTTLFRDPDGCDALAPDVQPLYAEDARQMPLITGEEQYLGRWTVTASLQWNAHTTQAQQFADTLTAALINVDEAFPP